MTNVGDASPMILRIDVRDKANAREKLMDQFERREERKNQKLRYTGNYKLPTCIEQVSGLPKFV